MTIVLVLVSRYSPVFDMKLDLEEALKEPEQTADGNGEEEDVAQPTGDKSPNIMDLGFSKEALQRLGYKFKGEEEEVKQEAPKQVIKTDVPKVDKKPVEINHLVNDSPLSAGYRSNYNSPSHGNSFSTTTDDDTPRPIIKKSGARPAESYLQGATNDYHTPPMSFPIPQPRSIGQQQQQQQQQQHEASRIEISPGLFVRNKNSGKQHSDATSLRREVANKSLAAAEDNLPEIPNLRTMNFREALEESSMMLNATAASPAVSAAASPFRNDDEMPPTPNLKTVNLREILKVKEKPYSSVNDQHKTFEGEENRDPEVVTPETPEFKDRHVRELVKSVGKGHGHVDLARLTPRGGAGGDDAVPNVSNVESPAKTPPAPVLSSHFTAMFDRETHL